MDVRGGVYGTHGENRNAYKVWMGKLNRRGPVGKPRFRWEIILKWVLEKYNWVV